MTGKVTYINLLKRVATIKNIQLLKPQWSWNVNINNILFDLFMD